MVWKIVIFIVLLPLTYLVITTIIILIFCQGEGFGCLPWAWARYLIFAAILLVNYFIASRFFKK